MNTATIRSATEADVPLVLQLIRELAEYERLAHEVTATERELHDSLFSVHPQAEVVIADVDGRPAGYALYFHNYSTFLCKRGLYLEDLFVRPEFRGRGIGTELLRYLARLAVERGCMRFEWAVLDWNQPAIDFYRGLGAIRLDDWRVFRLTGPALHELARQTS
ncbi:MAG TPA: GNAT family N-acetyltransferase [Gemmatimonadales bacterium]|jgi:GNAT superfamily N-acetyltransferase